MKINPMFIAAIGGLVIFFLWNQRRAQAALPSPSKELAPSSVPQEWIEMTPARYTVVGTGTDPWDILT